MTEKLIQKNEFEIVELKNLEKTSQLYEMVDPLQARALFPRFKISESMDNYDKKHRWYFIDEVKDPFCFEKPFEATTIMSIPSVQFLNPEDKLWVVAKINNPLYSKGIEIESARKGITTLFFIKKEGVWCLCQGGFYATKLPYISRFFCGADVKKGTKIRIELLDLAKTTKTSKEGRTYLNASKVKINEHFFVEELTKTDKIEMLSLKEQHEKDIVLWFNS